ncbi:SPOR domain-containing protein [Flavobacterium sp.]|uniref:SPOR domain-containing protein n=1 Tax=Flavobacterium sp. TaxID=239 RepID=UPI00260AB247|nr:SPOR domain-containing protein [Flavobacterium sp.]MDD3003349.1 SPOR domain-containing protein [Flavobacterium sp.]
MLKKILKSTFTICFLGCLFSSKTFAQTEKLKLSQDPKFEQLLNEKRKINSTIAVNEGYKIQIYTGDSENAKRELNKFKTEFNYLDATIIFHTPYYKVWVGNFKSKIEAQRYLLEIQRKHNNSIIIKPNK